MVSPFFLPPTFSKLGGICFSPPFLEHFVFTIIFIKIKSIILSFTALRDAPLAFCFLSSYLNYPNSFVSFPSHNSDLIMGSYRGNSTSTSWPSSDDPLCSDCGPAASGETAGVRNTFWLAWSARHMCRLYEWMFYVARNILGTVNHPWIILMLCLTFRVISASSGGVKMVRGSETYCHYFSCEGSWHLYH